MPRRKRDADRRQYELDIEAIATEGERGTAGAGRKRGSASTDAGAATMDEEYTPEFPSTAANQPHRGRGTGIKDKTANGKIPAKE
jgi:hypothetical protein